MDAGSARGGRMEDVGIVFRDRFGPRVPLEGRNLLPEVIQHRVWRRVAVMGSPMHLATGDDIDSRKFLFQDRGLAGTELGVRHRRHP